MFRCDIHFGLRWVYHATCLHQKSNFYIPGSKVWTLSAHIITVPSDSVTPSIVGGLKDIMESGIANGLTVCRLYEVRQASESVSIDPAVTKSFLASACQKAHGPNSKPSRVAQRNLTVQPEIDRSLEDIS